MTKLELVELLQLMNDDDEVVFLDYDVNHGDSTFTRIDSEVWIGPDEEMFYDYDKDDFGFNYKKDPYEIYPNKADGKKVLLLKRKSK